LAQELLKEQKVEIKKKILEDKKASLGEEPDEKEEGKVLVVFRKPTGNERMQRRFLKTDKIAKLYDYIDIEAADNNRVGFEVANDSDEIMYELVTPPTP
jgi:hypothetical protein